MSPARRKQRVMHGLRRREEQAARARVAAVCRVADLAGVPVVRVTRQLAVSDRTVRRWRHEAAACCLGVVGRPPRCATRDQRNQVFRFLRERGSETPLVALRAEFPQIVRADLRDLLARYRRWQRRKARRYHSRCRWLRPGTVWAADFKEPREPVEARYGAILSIRDLASRYRLAWEPVEEATSEVVQAIYAHLVAEHSPPLVMKSDNGGPFRAHSTKALLAQHAVAPLYNPKRRPSYNGGVERGHGPLMGYQAALAEFHGRPGLPTCEDAAGARRLANELDRPHGWQGPTAAELWQVRTPITAAERAAYLATVEANRAHVRGQLGIAPDEPLGHYAQASIDRRAMRDALVAHGLLVIEPRYPKRAARRRQCAPETATTATRSSADTGIIPTSQPSGLPTVGSPSGLAATSSNTSGTRPIHPSEEAHSSTQNLDASGQHYR